MNSGIAKDLVSTALNNCIGRPVIPDVLDFNAGSPASICFTKQRPLSGCNGH